MCQKVTLKEKIPFPKKIIEKGIKRGEIT